MRFLSFGTGGGGANDYQWRLLGTNGDLKSWGLGVKSLT